MKEKLKKKLFLLDLEFLKSYFIDVRKTCLLLSISLNLRILYLNVALR